MINKSEFCQFSLAGKIRLIDEFGKLLFIKVYVKRTMIIYRLFNFYVQVIYYGDTVEKAEPISPDMIDLFNDNN